MNFFVAKSNRGWIRGSKHGIDWADSFDRASRFTSKKKAENACTQAAKYFGEYHDLYREIDFEKFLDSLAVEEYEILKKEESSFSEAPKAAFEKAKEKRKRDYEAWKVEDANKKQEALRRAEEEVERLKRELQG